MCTLFIRFLFIGGNTSLLGIFRLLFYLVNSFYNFIITSPAGWLFFLYNFYKKKSSFIHGIYNGIQYTNPQSETVNITFWGTWDVKTLLFKFPHYLFCPFHRGAGGMIVLVLTFSNACRSQSNLNLDASTDSKPHHSFPPNYLVENQFYS